MKYQNSITKLVYDLHFDDSVSKKRYSCPECSVNSKRKNPKDLQFYNDTKIAYCHKCEATYFEYKPYENKKDYIVPKWRNTTNLTDKAVKWFNSRMISQETLLKMQIFSDREYMPQFNKEVEVICFPFFMDKNQINIKFRGANKSFKLVSGAELVWYNFDILKTTKEIIICEGEIDLLTWIENGFNNVVSVPNGAGGNLDYLDASIDLFNDIDKIYLATDNDSVGIKLRDELIRRLGPEKCYLINFKQFKDSNDYFIGNGGVEFKELIKTAKSIPVKGAVKIESFYNEIIDLYKNGVQKGLEINNFEIDKYITWELGRLATVTGIPSSGKSEFVDYVVTKLNLLHKWKVAYFTPENYPLKYHYRKIHEKLSGKEFDEKKDNTDFDSIYEYVKSNYYYIMDEEDMTVESVMETAKSYVKQNGIKILVIDPYNKLEHQHDSNMNETQYISKFLDILTNFAKFNNVLVFLVAHPRKMPKGEIPSLYDISGSANFYNKTDYGITVHRPRSHETGVMTNEVEIHIQKIKFKNLGEQGCAEMNYNYNNGRYESKENDINIWDNSDWLNSNPKELIEITDSIEPDFNNLVESEEMPF